MLKCREEKENRFVSNLQHTILENILIIAKMLYKQYLYKEYDSIMHVMVCTHEFRHNDLEEIKLLTYFGMLSLPPFSHSN